MQYNNNNIAGDYYSLQEEYDRVFEENTEIKIKHKKRIIRGIEKEWLRKKKLCKKHEKIKYQK